MGIRQKIIQVLEILNNICLSKCEVDRYLRWWRKTAGKYDDKGELCEVGAPAENGTKQSIEIA